MAAVVGLFSSPLRRVVHTRHKKKREAAPTSVNGWRSKQMPASDHLIVRCIANNLIDCRTTGNQHGLAEKQPVWQPSGYNRGCGGGWGTAKPTHPSSKLKTGAPRKSRGATQRTFGSCYFHSFEFQAYIIQVTEERVKRGQTLTVVSLHQLSGWALFACWFNHFRTMRNLVGGRDWGIRLWQMTNNISEANLTWTNQNWGDQVTFLILFQI